MVITEEGISAADVMPLPQVVGEFSKPLEIALEHVDVEQYSQQYVSYAGFGQPVHMPFWHVCLSCGQFEQSVPVWYG